MSLTSQAITVGITVTRIAQAAGSPLQLELYNNSQHAIYFGGSNVTTTNGFHLDKNLSYSITLYPGNTLYAIAASPAALNVLGQQL
jgi:hypothetical protein